MVFDSERIALSSGYVAGDQSGHVLRSSHLISFMSSPYPSIVARGAKQNGTMCRSYGYFFRLIGAWTVTSTTICTCARVEVKIEAQSA